MIIDENVVNFKSLLTDQAYFSGKSSEAFHLLSESMKAQVPPQIPQ
jgi:hypothetical protein